MKKFNENPFKKNTSVVPFSNGSEAESYHTYNCDECVKYENESKTQKEAKCKLAYHFDKGFILGTIPLWIAKEMGCDYNPLYQTCHLNNKCRYFDNGKDLTF